MEVIVRQPTNSSFIHYMQKWSISLLVDCVIICKKELLKNIMVLIEFSVQLQDKYGNHDCPDITCQKIKKF